MLGEPFVKEREIDEQEMDKVLLNSLLTFCLSELFIKKNNDC